MFQLVDKLNQVPPETQLHLAGRLPTSHNTVKTAATVELRLEVEAWKILVKSCARRGAVSAEARR